ncbi:MAG: FAD-dependent oxidoreductase [Gammaproteobacteria bacterium]|nr:FAD-dependent oxidoreductase [Gammaproteobacteria bacterium]MDH3750925.1 FAD-dependent oxidoreductase [Gammaproteobacteria bacterium]
MRVLVLGAGVVGVTTAYYLSQLGCDVTVVDRESDVALGTSFANAGQLSYSFTDSLARPDFFAQLPGLLLGRDPGSRIRIDPRLIGWGLRFLTQCTSRRAARNTVDLLSIAMRSGELMTDFLQTVPIEFSHRAAGKLILLTDNNQLRAAQETAALKRANGCDTDVLTRAESISIEPALADINEEFVAAVYSKDDSVADALQFTSGLRDHLESSRQVTFRLNAEVRAIETVQGQFKHVALENETIEADAIIVCAGVQSVELLRPLGIRLPIYPVRGYSVTLPLADASPAASITALRRRIAIARLGEKIRIAGFADFVGNNTNADQERIRSLLQLARDIAPRAADYDAADWQPWAENRPMTPDGRPFVGQSAIKNLYLNTGHGMLGWTLAHACAADVAAAVAR